MRWFMGLMVAALRISAGSLILLASFATHSQALTTLASFNGGNGENPIAGPTLAGNTLYGTTVLGGANGDGTVFSLIVGGGSPTVLASFNGSNGENPQASLTLAGNTLYGTTVSGGANGDGTVFSLPVGGGSPAVLTSFNGSNGQTPSANLTLAANTLYGTTWAGGTNEDGTVFSLPLSGGSPSVLASFSGGNGQAPYAGLTLAGNTLYGTTVVGGANEDGTVFSLPVGGGSPSVLASFNGSNGEGPWAGLTLVGNTLYGTTVGGGANGDGTVFSLPLSGGSPTVLASFNGSNGANPYAGLTLVGNTLYGTTVGGGANGDGTVFSLPLGGGSPSVLASFNGSNGANPYAGLTLVGNTLYGTTKAGGVNGDGTVFALPLNPWHVAGGGSWAAAANWASAGLPDGVNNWADFSQQTLAANATVTLDGSHTIGNLVFGDQGNAYNWTLAAGSGGTLTLQVSAGAPAITVNNRTATISAVLAGNQGLTTGGAGTLVLTASNTYSGGTTVSAGTLQLGDGLASNGSVQGNILDNAVLVFANPMPQTYSGSVSGNGSLTKLGGGLLVLSGSSAHSGGTTVSAGTLQLGDAVADNGFLQGNITNDATLAFANPSAQTFAGTISGGGGVVKTGSGTETLTAANTYLGPTTVSGGVLVLQGATQSSSLTAASGGTLQLAGITVNLGYQSLTAQSGGAVQYNAATIDGGYLRGPGVHATLPGGTSSLNGVTAYNSTVFQQNGTDNFTNFTSGGQVANNATLNWNGGVNASSGQLNVNAACNVQDWTSNGVVTVNSGGTLNNSVSDIVFGGGSRTTIDPGGQLNANSDGSGSAIDLDGALLVNNGTVTGTTNVYYGSLAQGSGTYGSVNVYNGGAFKPGNSPGTVTTGPVTWNSGGQYLVEINDATGTAGTNWNLWNVNGLLGITAGTTPNSQFTLVLESYSGGVPGLAMDFDDTINQEWLIADASDGISGFDPAEFTVNTTAFANNLNGGHFSVAKEGNQVFLTFAVPEPSSLALLAAGAMALVGCGWRRRRATKRTA